MTTTHILKQLLAAGALVIGLTGLASAEEIPERADVPEEYQWDLSDMYADITAWETDKSRFLEKLPKISKYEGRLAESGEILLEATKKIEEINLLVGNLYVYAGLRSNEDTRDSEGAARFSEAQGLYSQFSQQVAFFAPELLAIPEGDLENMVEETEGLGVYRHSLAEQLRMRDYTLSAPEEKLLAAAYEPLGKFNTVHGAFSDADIKFGSVIDENGEEIELSESRVFSLLKSPDRELRKTVRTELLKPYEAVNRTLAAVYEGHVKSRLFLAKARGFESRLEQRTYNDAIPIEVFHNLITAAREGAAPLQRYYQLRKKVLGYDKLYPWDMNIPIVKPTVSDISFEDAKTLVAEGLAPLGKEYLDVYWKGFDEGWVDAFANRGKRGGAYSWGTYTSKPYMSMNFEGSLDDVSTLAHEYGHSIHSYLARSTQPYAYGGYTTFLAEIASMTNEAILRQKMLKEAKTARERAYLLDSWIAQLKGGFYTQTAFADFEFQAQEKALAGEALTADTLNEIYADIFKKQNGGVVESVENGGVGWSRISHFFRTDNFYVYNYATSIAAATALSKVILEEGEPARERYLDMLRAGSSDYSIELLKQAGVDMTTPEPIYATIELFDDLVTQLEEALAEMEAENAETEG